jgi:DNA-binding transcriptional regulator YbjK
MRSDPPKPEATAPLRADARRNRDRIIEAAREVFAEHGLDASMNEVARHAEVGVATLFRRFPNREQLIAATFANPTDNAKEGRGGYRFFWSFRRIPHRTSTHTHRGYERASATLRRAG